MNIIVMIIVLALYALLFYGMVRLSIWIIKTAIKEALREYEQEKSSGSQEH